MRQSISTIWLTGIIFAFILLFSGYLAITISYSRAFKIKNEVLSIIEKRDGMTSNVGVDRNATIGEGKVKTGLGALQTIGAYMSASSYKSMGSCPNDYRGVYSLTYKKSRSHIEDASASSSKKYYYCYKKIKNGSIKSSSAAYYKVRLFYKMNLPLVGDIITFTIDGSTKEISIPQDNL